MQTTVRVQCRDQALQVNAPKLASGGVNEIRVEFSFCPLWDGFAKTAVFYREGEKPYKKVLDDADSCLVPDEVTPAPGSVYFGVFGVLGDVVRTSEVLPLKLLQGPPREGSEPAEPTPDIYEQILAEVQKAREAAEKATPVDIDLSDPELDDVDIQELTDASAVRAPLNGDGTVDNGTAGEVLQTNGDGTTKWVVKKSAHELAQEAGFTGTEQELAAKLAVDHIDWFGVGTSLPEGADLNTYKTNGKYYASSESRAQTIKNRPEGMNTNFCMWVFQRTSGSIYSQLMVTLAGKMYFRSSSSSAWRAWTAYTTSEEIEELTASIRQELLASAVQPDWNENDETATGYIQNRPFYAVAGVKVLLPEDEVIAEDLQGYGYGLCNTFGTVPLEAGLMYTVRFDGTDYECSAYPITDGDIHCVAIGNEDLAVQEIPGASYEEGGNGEPFAFVDWGGGDTALYTAAAGSYQVSVGVRGDSEEIVVNPRYKKALAFHPDWNENDSSAIGYIENRPFYHIQGGPVALPAETVVMDNMSGYYYGTPKGELPLQDGVAYTVRFDGTDYECSAYTLVDSDIVCMVIGNPELAVQELPGASYDGSSDEPFAFVDWGGGDTSLHTWSGTTHTVEVFEGKATRLERLPEKYLPESVAGVVVRSSTPGSSKRFRLTVDDTGTITVKEV